MNLTFHPLTPERWSDLEKLFGPNGACAGCWCMWWRQTQRQFEERKGARNRDDFRRIVEEGAVPGLLAYDGGEPVGWCAVQPREAYPRVARSRTLKPVDDEPVWSVSCFFVARPYRRKGLTVRLLKAAIEYARSRGASIVEGYPVEPSSPARNAWVWTGFVPAFERAGFVEVARRSQHQPIMRFYVE